jgi:hypothetical protein
MPEQGAAGDNKTRSFEEHSLRGNSAETNPLTLKYLELEYHSLRREIEISRDRHFKINIGALSIFPAFQLLAGILEDSMSGDGAGIEALFLLVPLPIVILTLFILYYAEHWTIARCARYLRENIEPAIPEYTGWETWLAQEQEKEDPRIRLQEKQQAMANTALYVVLYVASAVLALWQVNLVSGLRVVTVGLLIVYLAALIYVRLSTSMAWKDVQKMWLWRPR